MTAPTAEDRETLAIEDAIRKDPTLKQKRVERQLELDPVTYARVRRKAPKRWRDAGGVGRLHPVLDR